MWQATKNCTVVLILTRLGRNWVNWYDQEIICIDNVTSRLIYEEILSQFTVAILKQEGGVIQASTRCDPFRHICQFYLIPLPLVVSPNPHCPSLSPHPQKPARLPSQHLLTYNQPTSQPTPQLLHDSVALPVCPFLWQHPHYRSYHFHRTTGGMLGTRSAQWPVAEGNLNS